MNITMTKSTQTKGSNLKTYQFQENFKELVRITPIITISIVIKKKEF